MRTWMIAAAAAAFLAAAPIARAEEASSGESDCSGFPDQVFCGAETVVTSGICLVAYLSIVGIPLTDTVCPENMRMANNPFRADDAGEKKD